MDTAAVDFAALALGASISLVITIALWAAHRGSRSLPGWLVSLGLIAALVAIGLRDLLREDPRQTHLVTVFVGAALPVLGALGMIRGTRRVRAALRWPLIFTTTLVLLLSGLLIGAAVLPRFLP